MCMILDANMYGDFLKRTEDMIPIHKWLEKKNGKLVYSTYEEIDRELNSNKEMKRFFVSRKQSGMARSIEKDTVERAIKEIRECHDLKLQSNDEHILGLAKASDTKLLCFSDKALHKDFKEVVSGGSIYQNKRHEHLLTYDACP